MQIKQLGIIHTSTSLSGTKLFYYEGGCRVIEEILATKVDYQYYQQLLKQEKIPQQSTFSIK